MKPSSPSGRAATPIRKTSKYFLIILIIFVVRNYLWSRGKIPQDNEFALHTNPSEKTSIGAADERSLETEEIKSYAEPLSEKNESERVKDEEHKTLNPTMAPTSSPTISPTHTPTTMAPTSSPVSSRTAVPIHVSNFTAELNMTASLLNSSLPQENTTATLLEVDLNQTGITANDTNVTNATDVDLNERNATNVTRIEVGNTTSATVDSNTTSVPLLQTANLNETETTMNSTDASIQLTSNSTRDETNATLFNATEIKAEELIQVTSSDSIREETKAAIVSEGLNSTTENLNVTGMVANVSMDNEAVVSKNPKKTKKKKNKKKPKDETKEKDEESKDVVVVTQDVEKRTDLSGETSASSRSKNNSTETVVETSVKSKTSAKKARKADAEGTVIPNVLIAGAQKGGTTSIARYLNWTQSACFSEPSGISQGEGKESHFFDHWHVYNGTGATHGLPYYKNIFKHCKGQPLVVDATPEFMKTAERIHETYQEHGTLDSLKIIFTLREPVSREISWYNHRLRDCKTQQYAKSVCNGNGSPIPFGTVVDKEIVWRLENDDLKNMYSTYSRYLEVFFRLFKRSQILVLSYDELQTDKKALLRRIHKFLNLPGKPKELPHVNSDFGTHEDPPCNVQRALAKRFEPYNEALYTLMAENPGPKAEEKPFRRFRNKCFDEKYPQDEPDPFARPQPKLSKYIIPNILVSGGHEPLVNATTQFLHQFRNGCGPQTDGSPASPHFFDKSSSFKKGASFYQSFFEHCAGNDTFVIDGNQDLIMFPRRVREIYEAKGMADKVRFIFSLREPVRREVALFQSRAKKCASEAKNPACKDGKPLAFEDFAQKQVISRIQGNKFDYQGGLYAKYMKIWFEVWDRKQILILRHEESESDPVAYTGRIRKFLQIGARGKKKFEVVAEPDADVESPSCETEVRLSELFQPFNDEFYKLLGQHPGPGMEQSPFPPFDHSCETKQE